MSLGDFIRNKIKNRKDVNLLVDAHNADCVRCKSNVPIKQLEYNSQWKMYSNKMICDRCANSIEEKASRLYP